MGNALKYAIIAIGSMFVMASEAIIVAGATYIITRNYDLHHYGPRAVATAQADANAAQLDVERWKNNNRLLTGRLEATQESLATAREGLASSVASASIARSAAEPMSSRRLNQTYPITAYPTQAATPESTEPQRAQAKIDRIERGEWGSSPNATNDTLYNAAKSGRRINFSELK